VVPRFDFARKPARKHLFLAILRPGIAAQKAFPASKIYSSGSTKVAIKAPLVELSVLRRLGQPGFAGQDLERVLAPTYQSVSKSALRMAHREEGCETPDDAD
jgi:hypothetical protein